MRKITQSLPPGAKLRPESALTGKLRAIAGSAPDWLRKDPVRGTFGIDRQVYTDADLFELEMRYIFEGNWVYVAHESQLLQKHDFLTTYIGRQPVIVTRDGEGQVRVFLNTCSHRGARVCRERRGNRKIWMCGFHGWCYDSAGRLINVLDETEGGYPEGFDRAQLGLKSVARVASYRGFIFASINVECLPLEAYLGDARVMIDLLVDQAPNGQLQVLRGTTTYTYPGNWKLQAENGVDGYHVKAVHGNYMATVTRRAQGTSANDVKVFDITKLSSTSGGFFAFEGGHAVIWGPYPNFQDRPNYEFRTTYAERFGEERMRWMVERMRNLLLFPNVFLMDQMSTQIRIIRPLAVDATEVTTYCIAPVGESAQARERRIRQYEDFFNASGMATPDDLTEFAHCQNGFAARGSRWSDVSRGARRWTTGAGARGAALGMNAKLSSEGIADEGLYVALHEEWCRRVSEAAQRELEAAR